MKILASLMGIAVFLLFVLLPFFGLWSIGSTDIFTVPFMALFFWLLKIFLAAKNTL